MSAFLSPSHKPFLKQRNPTDDVLVQGAHLPPGLLVAGANLSSHRRTLRVHLAAQLAPGFLVACTNLSPDRKKLRAHLAAKLQNLRCELGDLCREFPQGGHLVFQFNYASDNELRRHRVSVF